MRKFLLFTLLLIATNSWGCRIRFFDESERCLAIHHIYLSEAYVLTKNCVGFSAPVSGRAYGYFAIGMYEGMVDLIPSLQSLEGQLNEYKRGVSSIATGSLNWRIVANHIDYTLLSYLYRNMPPSNAERLEHVYDSIQKIVKKGSSIRVRKNSIEYAETIAQAVIAWSKTDGSDNAFDDNFPATYEPPVCESCWTKTFPGYLPALLPYWGKNRQMLKNSHTVAGDMDIFEYSTDSNSIMYNEALMVLENSKESNPEYETIAEFWDDAAGYTGTPSGHFFRIARSVAIEKKLALEEAMELYVKLGVAVNEAFISAFTLKYKFNFIRPITYIHRYIDPQFNTRLGSPPFPEYPSGHSFQSGAASEVMKSVFGDQTTIVDSTNYARPDINGTPRVYKSFTELSEEISISRFYGGIHFKRTLDNSLMYGRKIGQYVVSELKCRKR